MKSILVISLVAILCGCSGEPLLQGFDQNDFPFSAHVSVVHHPVPDETGAFSDYDVLDGKAFATDQGYLVTLEHATVSWKRLLLLSDGDDPECEPGHDREMHLDGTENLLGEDLLATSLGHFEIEDRPYCEFEVTLGPITSESHAILLADHADDEGTGNLTDAGTDLTIDFGGTWSKGSQSGHFEVHSVDEVTVLGVFMATVDGEAVEHPIHLHEDETELDILFGIKYDQLFDGIDFEADTEIEIEKAVLENLEDAVHQHLGAAHS